MPPKSGCQSRYVHDVKTQKITVLRISASCECITLTKYYSRDKTEKKETDGTYGTYGEQERCIQNFGGEI